MNYSPPQRHYTLNFCAGNLQKFQTKGSWHLNCSSQLVNLITMAAKKTAKKTPTALKPAAKKAVVKHLPAQKATTRKPATPAKPSLDLIARAAYLNYRRRVENGLPGDSHGDWLEAERKFSS